MLSRTGSGPGAPRRGPFSSPNRFQIINNSVVSPPLFQNIIRKKSEKMRCERNGVERASLKKFWKMALPFWNFSSASPYSIFYRFWENQENGFAPQHKIVRCSTVLLGQGRFPILRKGTPIFLFWRFKIQPRKGALLCANKFKKSVAPKSSWKNVRVSAVCTIRYSLPPRGCSTPTRP